MYSFFINKLFVNKLMLFIENSISCKYYRRGVLSLEFE